MTGADYTIIPRYFSQKLQISLQKDCIEETTVGVGGIQKIYFLKSRISVQIGNLHRKIPLAFFDNNEVPAILGRLGFLETFNVEFLKSHRTVFKN